MENAFDIHGGSVQQVVENGGKLVGGVRAMERIAICLKVLSKVKIVLVLVEERRLDVDISPLCVQ